MDIVTLGAALNGSAEYVNSHFKGGSNIQIVDNPDGTQTINASGEVSAEDTVARAEIAEMKDGETLDSFGAVETALADKADEDNVYKLALSNADLLPANTDLDNVKTVGSYYVYDSVNVTTITNRPTNNTSAFRLTVEYAAEEKRTRQIYQEFNSFDKYIRWENSSNVFSEWKKVECDLSTKQNTISDLSTIRSGAALGATAVQPETGKGLSTNDYTTAEKTKLAGIAQGAEVNEIESIKVNNTTINPDANKVVNITVPTTAADVSALPDTTKYAVALSLTINSSTFVMTGQLKDQNGDNLGTAQTIDLPLESVVVGGSYNSQTKKVVLTLQNGNTIEFSVADLVSGLQTELSASNKLNPAYIDYDSTHRAVSDTEKSVWNSKQNALSSTQLDAVNSGIDSTKVAQIETNKNNISFAASQGRKNVLKFDSVGSGSPSGITYTVNDDGTVRASGTANATSYAYLRLNNSNFDIKKYTNGQFVLSGCPSGGGSDTYSLYAARGNYAKFDYGDGVILTPTSESEISIVLRVEKSQTVDIVFKPMIRLVGTDSTFEPYAPTNAELTAKEQVNENNILSVLDANGAKNQLDYTLESLKAINSRGTWVDNVYTVNNVKYTVNSDMSITAETVGTPSGSTLLALKSNVANSYVGAILSGCPTGGNNATYNIAVEQSASPYTLLAQDTGLSATIPNNTSGNIIIYVVVKTTLSNPIVFKPMICSADLWAISRQYQPYAFSNAELTAAIQALQAQLANQ